MVAEVGSSIESEELGEPRGPVKGSVGLWLLPEWEREDFTWKSKEIYVFLPAPSGWAIWLQTHPHLLLPVPCIPSAGCTQMHSPRTHCWKTVAPAHRLFNNFFSHSAVSKRGPSVQLSGKITTWKETTVSEQCLPQGRCPAEIRYPSLSRHFICSA